MPGVMGTGISESRRAVLATGEATPARLAAATARGGKVRTIANPARVRELLQGALVQREARLCLRGVERALEVALDALPPAAGRPAVVAVRLAPDDALAFDGRRGQSVALWFALPSGVHGFRSRILDRTPEGLWLEMPAALVRYSGRTSLRYAVRPEYPPQLVLPLTDRSRYVCRDVVELSTGGLSMLLPADIDITPGTTTRVALHLLHHDRPLLLTAACRYVRPAGDGHNRIGLQFVDPPRLAVLGIERYVQKMELRTLEDDPISSLTPLGFDGVAGLGWGVGDAG